MSTRITVDDLLNGARANLPIVDSTAFRKARREATAKQSEMDV